MNDMPKLRFSLMSSPLLFSTILLSLMFLSGCSSPKSDLSKLGTLRTHIRDDGTKLFVFTSKQPRRTPGQIKPGKPQNGSADRPGTRQPRRSDQPDRVSRRQNTGGRTGEGFREHLLKALEERLEQTGYCREGYLPLGTYLEFGQFEIRGECQETATKEDRLLFPGGPVYGGAIH